MPDPCSIYPHNIILKKIPGLCIDAHTSKLPLSDTHSPLLSTILYYEFT